MPQLLELTATFLRERFRFANPDGDVIVGDAWINGEVQKEIAVKGQADLDELRQEQTYRFYGHWTTYKNKRSGETEEQFAFQSFVLQTPHSREGVINYLIAAGEGKGFGRARAARVWEWFGSDAVKTFRENPDLICDKLAAAGMRLSADNAKAIAAKLEEEAAVEGCTLDLMDLLTGRGFPKGTSRLAVRQWGNRAAQKIRRDPYCLMAFRGCGFKRTDALYLDLKLPPSRLKRQALSAWYALASDSEGHTWYPHTKAVNGIKGNIAGTELQIEKALRLARIAGATTELYTAGGHGPICQGKDSPGAFRWIAEGKKARNEAELAQRIADAGIEVQEEQVIYRECQRFPGYRVGTDGTVWSSWTNGGKRTDEWSLLKTDTIKGGYQRVRLRESTMSYRAVQVSHLILESFVGPRPLIEVAGEFIEFVACHGNSNPADNSLRNLRWDTRSSNEDDKRAAGTHQTGSGNPAAKLDEDQVREIRRLYEDDGLSTYKLSAQFEVTRSVVSKIVRKESWSHVE